jgi:hypothetical protein
MTPEETLDWLAQQHFDQCREARPIQDWIRKMKSQLPKQEHGCEFCNHPLYVGTKCKNCGASKQEQGEPVSWMYKDSHVSLKDRVIGDDGLRFTVCLQEAQNESEKGSVQPLYTTPQQRTWVGLTDDEQEQIINSSMTPACAVISTEAKLKEKNT